MDCWELADKVIGRSNRVLLYGPPGTGKTFAATKYSVEELDKVNAITLTEDSSAAELRGFYIPNEEGAFSWQDGIGVQAWKHGNRLVINEIDHAGGDCSTFLHALLDDPEYAFITLPNQEAERVQPHGEFKVVSTMNGTPDMLSPALRDRFPVCINIDSVHPEALKGLSKDIRTLAGELAVTEDESRRTSIRSWVEFDRLRVELSDRESAYAVFGEHLGDDLLDTMNAALEDE